RLLLLVARRIRLAHCRRTRPTPAPQQRKKVLLKDHTQDQQDQCSANSQVHAAELKSPTSAALIAAIFNILAGSARRPFHGILPVARRARWYHFQFLVLMNM